MAYIITTLFKYDRVLHKLHCSCINKIIIKISPYSIFILRALTFFFRPPHTFYGWLKFLQHKLPILEWVLCYKKHYLFGDVIAGLTVAVITIYQSEINVILNLFY